MVRPASSLFLLRLIHRDGLDRDFQSRIRDSEFRGRPGGRLIRKEFLVGLVHRLEIRGVGEEDGRLHDRSHREPEFFED